MKGKLSIFCMLTALAVLPVACNRSNSDNGPIRLNQVGYAPEQEKTATIVLDEPFTAFILDESGDTVLTANSQQLIAKENPISGKTCRIVDFSSLTMPGEYTLCVKNELSIFNFQFSIRERPYRELTRKALRAYYHQRASMATEEPYAEGYARPAGHPDDHVLVHASAATDERPEGTVISSPGGWYDAGDYNKYIVNSGYTMSVWFMAYEMNKEYFDTLKLNIPESANANANANAKHVPDMLQEAMYNLRWMLTMQDTDGGVYHKLTEPDFEGFIRPDQCQKPRYVVMKTTAATLDFAATMALAARIYAPFEDAFPGFCAQAKEAAEMAFAWALDNPEVYYDQPAMNEQFAPAITTGAYDDFDVDDEFYWAAIELAILTGDKAYKMVATDHAKAIAEANGQYTPSVWGNVAELGYLDWLMHSEDEAKNKLGLVYPDEIVIKPKESDD